MVRLLSLASLAVHAAAFEWAAEDEAVSLLQHKVMGHHLDHKKVTVGEEKGNELTRRATPDGATNIEFVDTGAGPFAENGKLASVKFYVQRAGNKGLRFRIYRPSGGGYQFVGQTEEIEIPQAGVVQEYTFSEQVPFLAGDYIGWKHTGNGNIPFDGSGTNVFWHYGPNDNGCVNVPSSGTQARTYSYMITTAPATAADYADGELCGAEVPEGLADEGAAEGDPHLTYGSKKRDVDQSDVHHGREAQLIQRSKRGNVNCGFSADACKMECEKVGKTFGVASPRSNGQAGWPGVGDYAGVGCYTYTPRMARFLGQDTANSCVYGIMDSGKHPESDAELVSTHRAWAQFGPGTGARQLYVRLPNTFGNPNGVNHCEDLEEPTDPNPEDTENEEQAEQEAQQELENEDQASATGDPHMTTNTGDHFDKMQRVKAHELRNKDQTACVEELQKHRKELASLRVSKVAAAPQVKLAKVRAVRKNIAKVLTVLNEKRRSEAKDAFKKNKYTPYDLRLKKTRAFRRRMTRFEKTRQTSRQQKRADNSKLRKYAVAA